MAFLDKDYFLNGNTARELYHDVAAPLDIIDFHTHLDPLEILESKRFDNITELWLAHDHYKWRLMRGAGIDEAHVTGNADPKDKFTAFATALELAPANPVHHWTHLELKRVFGIDDVITTATADDIWKRANDQLKSRPELNGRDILTDNKVKVVCTTDSPADDLSAHIALKEKAPEIAVYPAFRLDAFTNLYQPDPFIAQNKALSETSNTTLNSIGDMLNALKGRHDFFVEQGCRMSDQSVRFLPSRIASEEEANKAYIKTLNGEAVSEVDMEAFSGYVMSHFAKWNADAGLSMFLHIGVRRNNSLKNYQQLGPDRGFDTMAEYPQARHLVDFFSHLEHNDSLPKCVVFNLNPNDTHPMCCALQSFQRAPHAGRHQFGPPWWHVDNKNGILEHLKCLSTLGSLGSFIGMLTDSRSSTAFVRHEYFRRLLCDFIGTLADNGEIPDDADYLSNLIRNICYTNAKNYLGFNN